MGQAGEGRRGGGGGAQLVSGSQTHSGKTTQLSEGDAAVEQAQEAAAHPGPVSGSLPPPPPRPGSVPPPPLNRQPLLVPQKQGFGWERGRETDGWAEGWCRTDR